jgi:hypothetical protein
MVRLLSWCCLALLPLSSFAQAGPPEAGKTDLRRYEVRRAASKVEVDGRLDEAAWSSALVFDVPYEWQPGDNVEPPVKTDFLVTYDDENLYVAFKAYDPRPAEIRAHVMDRDLIDTFVQDDHIVLMIDTFNDERRGFQFRVNPLGVQADAVFSQNEGIEDWSFDMIWDSAGRITEEGYIVEVAIPLAQIRFSVTEGSQTWGFDVGRSYPRSVRHRIAAARHERGNTCVLCQVVKVTGFESLKPGRNLEITPTVTANRNDVAGPGEPAPGPLQSGDEEFEAGVTARWGVTPNIALSAALNPDFSQVEADVAQINVNQRFALFFPEKRPFFLEGIDFFATPLDAVFTRTIVDPRWGGKVTGKQGDNAFGVFVAEDDVDTQFLTIPGNQGSFSVRMDEIVTTGVLRYRRDIGSGSSLGVLYTGREGDGTYHNRVAGLDGFGRFSPADTLRVQFLRSDTLYPDQVLAQLPPGARSTDAFQGDAILADYRHNARDWSWSLRYHDREPEFRADAGFIPRVDLREALANVQRQIYGEQGKNWYSQINVGLWGSRTEDHSGQLTDEQFDLYANFSGPLQSFVEVSLDSNTNFVDRFERRLYEDMTRFQVFSTIQPNQVGRYEFFVDFGETVDFTNNQPADTLVLQPSAELKLGRNVNAKIDHTLQRLDVDGGELFEANLTQLRLIYNFNVRSFVRGIFQYLDLQQNPALYRDIIRPAIEEETQTFFTQLLFAYKLNPQTVLFLGYTDDRVGAADYSLTERERAFFFKVGYALVM